MQWSYLRLSAILGWNEFPTLWGLSLPPSPWNDVMGYAAVCCIYAWAHTASTVNVARFMLDRWAEACLNHMPILTGQFSSGCIKHQIQTLHKTSRLLQYWLEVQATWNA